MRHLIYTLLFAVSLGPMQSQILTDKNLQVTRIPLAEKFNLSARALPKLLIKAFCEGRLQGYYPLRPGAECSYPEFVAHFNLVKTQPILKETDETAPCPAAFCANTNDEAITPFCMYYDIIEEKITNAQTSTSGYVVKYIRLIYTKEKYGATAYYMGPLFKYKDVEALTGKEFSLLNPKNTSSSISFKQYFEGKIYTGFILGSELKPKKPKPKEHIEH